MMTPLAAWIRDQLSQEAGKRITFAQFMEWALYHPTFGYYKREKPKVGKGGDFYTSAHVSSLFGEVLANFIDERAQSFGKRSWRIIEFGGGDGKLAEDILSTLTHKPSYASLVAYCMVESSLYHRDIAKKRLSNRFPVQWVEQLGRRMIDDPVIVLSNEFVDALPVHRLRYIDGDWREIYVIWNEERKVFEESLGECSSPALIRYIRKEQPPQRNGQTIEVNLSAYEWLKQLAQTMRKGYILTIDYGDEKEKLWSSMRREGTLMCYYRHRALTDPYVQVGEQDMTAHVNFSSLCRWGEEFDLSTILFMTQGQFLLQAGILQKLREHDDPNPFSEVAKRNRAIRQLITTPGGMGDTFKVLLQGRGVPREV